MLCFSHHFSGMHMTAGPISGLTYAVGIKQRDVPMAHTLSVPLPHPCRYKVPLGIPVTLDAEHKINWGTKARSQIKAGLRIDATQYSYIFLKVRLPARPLTRLSTDDPGSSQAGRAPAESWSSHGSVRCSIGSRWAPAPRPPSQHRHEPRRRRQ